MLLMSWEAMSVYMILVRVSRFSYSRAHHLIILHSALDSELVIFQDLNNKQNVNLSYSETLNDEYIGRIYQMSSWQFFNELHVNFSICEN